MKKMPRIDSTAPTPEAVIDATTQWLERAVIGLNLCPFAKAVHVKKQIRFEVSKAISAQELIHDLIRELGLLATTSPEVVETTLLILPLMLDDFLDYNHFLSIANGVLEELNLVGEIQIASFHPQYQFAGTQSDDIDNYTNRSPWPILHLLREESMNSAVAAFPEAEKIFEKNIETLQRLGHEGWNNLVDW